jgi:hypothetical protein
VKKIVMCVALLLLVLGCSSSNSSDKNVDAWEREVEIISPSQIGERQYEEIGGLLEVREPIRSTYAGEDDAIEAAKRSLRRRAAELDADALVIIECGRHVRPMEETNLPSTGPEVICHGGALRWMD